ncbi:hypothetical protein [Pseudomonas putida]|uniref:ART-PolyVal-like domain-containing protein n=1 Tax=Pseudomonas putida TaxID=303 RepID=A0A8I1JJK6_PSEPU|nr:hypothetical protein [Pseudomonas putida]MBI6882475.1 hypothetical protein [Pseudomonas putida]
MIMYHGTNYSFEKFDKKYLGMSCSNPTTIFGFFFTDSVNDAISWAKESARKSALDKNPKVVEVFLDLKKVKKISYEQFFYYLQKARKSTIEKHLGEWMAEGFDGLSVRRNGCEWICSFCDNQVEVVKIYEGSELRHLASEASNSVEP